MPDLSVVLGLLFKPCSDGMIGTVAPPPLESEDILDATVRPALPIVRPGLATDRMEPPVEKTPGLDLPTEESPAGNPLMPPRLPPVVAARGFPIREVLVAVLPLVLV